MSLLSEQKFSGTYSRLPAWFRQPLPDIQKIEKLRTLFRSRSLSTVCEDARCPNLGRCWGQGVATFMILGNVCTRACRFCAVKTGAPQAVDLQEPGNVAEAVKEMGLRYAVITSVTRDDLADGGAGQFARVVQEIRRLNPETKIELLIPDCQNDTASLRQIVNAGPDVVAHNLETVRRLSKAVRPQANYQRSLDVLKQLKELAPGMLVKSGLMVGLGENDRDIEDSMKDLAAVGCDILTIGQYLAPSHSERHVPVSGFVSPEKFEEYKQLGLLLGLCYVLSGSLVRSSYLAEQGYLSCCRNGR